MTAVVFASCRKEEKAPMPIPVAPNTALDTNQAAIRQPTNEEVGTANATRAEGEQREAKHTEITFNKTRHDFGTINQGDKVSYVFTFTNTGENDLLINRANGSCGCTVPEFPKEPIPPGKTGSMKVSFNSAGKTGPQHKTVTVFANVPNGTVVLDIEANIIAKK